MRIVLTLLFMAFVGAMWTFYATDVWPWNGAQANMVAAVVGIIFMAVLVIIGFRIDGVHRRP